MILSLPGYSRKKTCFMDDYVFILRWFIVFIVIISDSQFLKNESGSQPILLGLGLGLGNLKRITTKDIK